jgi:thiol-disulfide isomerase/thioredoxin
MKAIRRMVVALIAGLIAVSVAAQDVRPFSAGSYARILSAHGERPLIVAFWSLTCPHCQEELDQLARLSRAHPRLALVLVSTDSPADNTAIAATLKRHGLDRAESWVFADDSPERLRFEVDRRWRGELPRTHLVAPGSPPRAVTGKLDTRELERWLRSVPAP